MGVWQRIRGAFRSRARIINDYAEAGGRFGHAVSYLYLGECDGFAELLDAWEAAENEVIRLGFRTLPIDAFVEYGGYGTELPPLTERGPDKTAVSHARYYREMYLGRTQHTVVTEALSGRVDVVVGTYELPTSAHLARMGASK